jgi:hypothetical protein
MQTFLPGPMERAHYGNDNNNGCRCHDHGDPPLTLALERIGGLPLTFLLRTRNLRASPIEKFAHACVLKIRRQNGCSFPDGAGVAFAIEFFELRNFAVDRLAVLL